MNYEIALKTGMSKGDVDRLGNQIRSENDSLSEKTLSLLQLYRISHKDSLARIFNILCTINRKMSKQNIVTYRIKRFESIIGKLNRYPKMQFSRMWDVGGCRCIVSNNNDVYLLKKKIEENEFLEIRKEYDYIQSPQNDGYKSLHLFINLKNDSTIIELQIRNQEDHNWATLVEISDLLFDAKLKEYGNNTELLRFHYLLSKRDFLSFEEKKEIAVIVKKHKYVERLSYVFSRNYIQVRKQWLLIESQHNRNYFLIEANKDTVPKITSYKKFEDAENDYFKIYRENETANVVLTHLPKPNYQQISIAYSNYILTFHSFLEDCFIIFDNLVQKTLLSRKYFDFINFYILYNEIIYHNINNLISELVELIKISNNNSKNKINIPPKLKQKEKDWAEDINKQIKKRNNSLKHSQILLKRNMSDKTFQNKIFKLIAKIISKKYNKKIKRAIDSQNKIISK